MCFLSFYCFNVLFFLSLLFCFFVCFIALYFRLDVLGWVISYVFFFFSFLLFLFLWLFFLLFLSCVFLFLLFSHFFLLGACLEVESALGDCYGTTGSFGKDSRVRLRRWKRASNSFTYHPPSKFLGFNNKLFQHEDDMLAFSPICKLWLGQQCFFTYDQAMKRPRETLIWSLYFEDHTNPVCEDKPSAIFWQCLFGQRFVIKT